MTTRSPAEDHVKDNGSPVDDHGSPVEDRVSDITRGPAKDHGTVTVARYLPAGSYLQPRLVSTLQLNNSTLLLSVTRPKPRPLGHGRA